MNLYNEKEMRVHYESWQTSGLSKKAYAIGQSVNPHTFYYWVKKFEAVALPTGGGFQAIELSGTPATSAMAVVRYPSGVSIEWHGSADTVHLLKALL